VDDSTRAVFVNTPHNPTGSVMTAGEQKKLAEALAARSIPLIVDEVYHPLYFAGDAPSASVLPNTIVLGDFAKALSIPGLRIGWLIDRDAQRREALLDLRSYFTISGSPLTEAVGAHALAHAPVILQRLRDVARANLELLTRFMEEHRAGARLGAARRRHHVFPLASRWPRFAPVVRSAGEGGRAGGAG
jgi:aspartate/methionine/tyrosine aminotransferase